jgi:hypothetical protein
MFGLFKLGSKASKPAELKMHRTSRCKAHNHPEFEIRASATLPESHVAWLLGFLEERVAGGERFKDGESLQVGWMYARVEQAAPDLLRIAEPDMKHLPIQFVDSVDAILNHVFVQKETALSLRDVTPDFPSLRQRAIVHANYRTAQRVLLSRFAAKDEADSGWWFTDLDDEQGSQDPARFSVTSLYQLGIDRPDLIKFFALPAGLQAVVEPDHIGVIDEQGEREQIEGSYLWEFNRKRSGR